MDMRRATHARTISIVNKVGRFLPPDLKTWNKAVVTKAVRDMVKRHVFHERPRTH